MVPVVALLLYGRHRGRSRRREVSRLPEAREMLDGATVERVLGAWQQGRHADAAARHVPLFYPPGPDGVTVARLAERTGEDEAIVARLLAELHELGYLDVDGPEGAEQAVALTLEGYDLLDATESVLLETARERGIAAAAAPQNSG